MQPQNSLLVIDAINGEIMLAIQAGLSDDVSWSPDGMMLATATAEFDGRTSTAIRVWDSQSGGLIAQLTGTVQGHTREAHTVQWLPDGQQLLSAADDNTVRIWQVQPELGVNQFRE